MEKYQNSEKKNPRKTKQTFENVLNVKDRSPKPLKYIGF